jgi:hypothetical protein
LEKPHESRSSNHGEKQFEAIWHSSANVTLLSRRFPEAHLYPPLTKGANYQKGEDHHDNFGCYHFTQAGRSWPSTGGMILGGMKRAVTHRERVRLSPTIRKALDHFFDSSVTGALLRILGVGIVLAPLWLGLQWVTMGEAGRYAAEYHVPKESVTIQKKPADCNWDTAPLENKNCHFVKHVDPIKDEQGHVSGVAVYWDREAD